MKFVWSLVQFIYCMVIINGNIIQNENKNCVRHPIFTGILNCEIEKIVKLLNTEESFKNYEIVPGISLISDSKSTSRSPKELNKYNLPLSPYKRLDALIELLLNSTSRFLSTKTLQIRLESNTSEALSRAIEEGRGKMKRMVGPWMFGVGAMAMVMIPVIMGGLTLFTAKSLLIGTIALVVSLILFIHTFFSGTAILLPQVVSYGSGLPSYGPTYGPSYLPEPSYPSYGVNQFSG